MLLTPSYTLQLLFTGREDILVLYSSSFSDQALHYSPATEHLVVRRVRASVVMWLCTIFHSETPRSALRKGNVMLSSTLHFLFVLAHAYLLSLSKQSDIKFYPMHRHTTKSLSSCITVQMESME
jgi:hypothetical protein